MQRHHEPRRQRGSSSTRIPRPARDTPDSDAGQRGVDDTREEGGAGLRATRRNRDVPEHVEVDAPHSPRNYRSETGLSYDQSLRSREQEGAADDQRSSTPQPFRFRHGEYTLRAGRALPATNSAGASISDDVTVRTISLSVEDEALRDACEREAWHPWPGARVLVDLVGERYRAAVYLPEDGVQPDTSAQQSAPRDSAGAALHELMLALRSHASLRAH